jgi:hypothetical protein
MMKNRAGLVVLFLVVVFLSDSFCSAAVVRRFAIVAGANLGGPGRTTLRYAVSDAMAFASLIQDLGGVREVDCRLLREPSLIDFGKALQDLKTEIENSRSASQHHVELIFYYSGHADEEGLLLAGTRFPYERIREEISLMNADVNVAILDACASGAITRRKGVVRQPGFLPNSASAMKGYAFLTSSSEHEAAQESDRIRASFFTYYLLSGLRGAADSNGDGKVSLNEAYEFSYNETLGRTAKTQGGPQHPAYDIQMSGTGELVLTDVRQISSRLVLPEDLSGRIYIMNADRQLVAELFKPQGREIELGMESGSYTLYLDSGTLFLAASVKLADKQTTVLEKQSFTPAKREPSTVRGPSIYTAERQPVPPVRKFEVGGHYSSIHSNLGYEAFSMIQYEGVGGRFTYNLNNSVAFEAGTDFFKQFSHQRVVNLFGAKVGVRRHTWGLFAKIQPGLVTYREMTLCFADANRPCNPQRYNHTRFALDFGGVFELYDFGILRSDRLFFRVDVGDTLASYVDQLRAHHNPRVSIGAGFRF